MAVPIGAFLGAGVGLVNAMLQRRAQQDAMNLQWRNLMFQQQQARKQNRLATAAREDVFGNRTSYDDITNEWDTELTPTQEGIIRAQEREQYLSLTEDAKRKRDLRRRQQGRSEEAEEVYNKLLSGYRYDTPPSEAESVSDLTRTMVANRKAGLDQGKAVLAGQALRLGRGGDIQKLIKSADDQMGQSLEQIMAEGKLKGSQLADRRRQAHEQAYRPALTQFANIMDDIGEGPQQWSSLPQQVEQREDKMMSAISSAMNNESTSVGQVLNSLATTAGRSAMDLSPVASALSKISFDLAGRPQYVTGTTVEPYSIPGLQEEDRQIGSTGAF